MTTETVAPRDYRPGLLDAVWVRTTGRSWWQAVYTDGRILSEWQTLENGDTKSTRWEETRRNGLRTLILICPNGQALRLTSGEDNKLFQFKQGVSLLGRTAEVLVHLIGVVTNTSGDCVCFAWEPTHRELVADPAKRELCLVHAPSPHDGEGRYRRLDFKGVDGVPVESAKFKGLILAADGSCYCSRWRNVLGRAIKFEDNVMRMAYGGIGPLGLDNLRLRF